MTAQSRVLIAEDDPAIRTMLREMLAREGFVVESAVDGQDAIDKIQQSAFDAILLDLMMPRVSGLDVIEYLERISPDTVATRVIVITAASNRYLEELEGKTVFRIMRKPFVLNELIEVLRECLAMSV
jgi:CheY-like chemotaxis protein